MPRNRRTPSVWRAASLGCALCALAVRADALELQHVQTRYQDGEYRLELSAVIDAPLERVDAVIRDYAHYRELDRRIVEARITARPAPDRVKLYTRVNVCFGLWCRKVDRLEEVQEAPHELHAVSIPESSDVRRGETMTQLSPAGERTQLHYVTSIAPKFWVPAWFGRSRLLTTLRDASVNMFENVERRAQAPAPNARAAAAP